MKLFSVLRAQTKFLSTDVMLKKWLSYTKVIVQWILQYRWTSAMIDEVWETLAKGDAIGEELY